MSILKIRDADGNMQEILAIRGEPGNPGVYLGSGDMPEGYFVQIDPNGEAIGIAPDTIIECGPFYNYDDSSSSNNCFGYWFERRLDGTFTMKIYFFRNSISIGDISLGLVYYSFWRRLPFCIFEVNNVVLDLDDNYPIDADNKKYFVGSLIQEGYPDTSLEYEIPGVSDNASFYVILTEPSIFDNLPENITTIDVSGYATITGRWRE